MTRRALAACAAAAGILAIAVTMAAGAGGATSAVNAIRNGQIAYTAGAGSEGVRVIDPDGSGSRLLIPSPQAPCASVHGCWMDGLAWAPDGTRLAFSRENPSTSPSTKSLFVVDADGSGEHHLLTCRTICNKPAWSPDGTRLAVANNDVLYVVAADGRGLHRVTRRDAFSEGDADGTPLWSPDGSRILFSRGSLYTVKPDGFGLRRVRGTAGASGAEWLDTRTITFSVAGDKLYKVGIDGSSLQPLLATSGADDLYGATWSPDRTRIVVVTDRRISGDARGYDEEVWVARTNGRSRRRIFHQKCCIDYSATAVWSPDGRRIAIAAGPGVFLVDADGSRLHRLRGIDKNAWGYPSIAWQALR